jgi:putative oxidoreductase
LQRLYSTFPDGRPGVGLLLLRLTAGGSLIVERMLMMMPLPPSPQWEINTTLICVGACVCLGLWTPVMAGLEAVAELLVTLSQPSQYQTHILLAVLSVGLAMLGPGAASIDASIFGRKRITVLGQPKHGL